MASCLGLGVLLLASEEVAIRIRDEDFLMAQVDGLITYIRSARPGTLSVFRSIEVETRRLMFGDVCNELIDAAHDDDGGPLSELSIYKARSEDEIAILNQTTGNEWRVTRTEEVAKEVAAGFFF
ncbi:serine-proline rich protein [Penicillium brevicompactum]|uniref:serine-proline rich protein n=1 Tax=Penicillium brevicompactum TaxID=5074 RepID=UPI0025405FA6|nr:serine-proline rich protein [Penicillium brevicompactum]KAJ5346800.1 serine-proline rich protein [Penicillium brevicompactum]